jgi:hypothetical protein
LNYAAKASAKNLNHRFWQGARIRKMNEMLDLFLMPRGLGSTALVAALTCLQKVPRVAISCFFSRNFKRSRQF